MSHQGPNLGHQQINYSFEYWWALGIHHFERPGLDGQKGSFATSNFLINRWNEAFLQANLYGLVGFGQSEFATLDPSDDAEDTAFGGLQFDIEDRRYYFLIKYLGAANEDEREFSQTVVRAGLTPYQGEFYDLHTWIILEWSENRFGNHTKIDEVTPLLRFFYRNILFEIGQNLDGETKFNFIAHF